MEPPGPVDGDVVGPFVEPRGCVEGGAGVAPAKVVEVEEEGAILIGDVEAFGNARRQGHQRARLAEEVDVVVRMEAAKVALLRAAGEEHLHAVEEAVFDDEVVGDGDPERPHHVPRAVVVIPHLGVVEVAHSAPRLSPANRRGKRVPPRVHGDLLRRRRSRRRERERGVGEMVGDVGWGGFIVRFGIRISRSEITK